MWLVIITTAIQPSLKNITSKSVTAIYNTYKTPNTRETHNRWKDGIQTPRDQQNNLSGYHWRETYRSTWKETQKLIASCRHQLYIANARPGPWGKRKVRYIKKTINKTTRHWIWNEDIQNTLCNTRHIEEWQWMNCDTWQEQGRINSSNGLLTAQWKQHKHKAPKNKMDIHG